MINEVPIKWKKYWVKLQSEYTHVRRQMIPKKLVWVSPHKQKHGMHSIKERKRWLRCKKHEIPLLGKADGIATKNKNSDLGHRSSHFGDPCFPCRVFPKKGSGGKISPAGPDSEKFRQGRNFLSPKLIKLIGTKRPA